MTERDKLKRPSGGKLYHGVYPGIADGEGDDITVASLIDYMLAVRKKVAWVYFSNEWLRCRRFPSRIAEWVRDAGAVPFIRLMLRSSLDDATKYKETVYTLFNILNGTFDKDLSRWGAQARAFGSPLLVEYGTECNGKWMPWNGTHNGKDTKVVCPDKVVRDGPEQFVAAYRHIVEVMRQQGADNITWVFHVDAHDSPCSKKETWNAFERYYPKDDVIDWLAVSCYGAQSPGQDYQPEAFPPQMRGVYDRFKKLAPDKPVVVAEFGCAPWKDAMHEVKPADWAREALKAMLEFDPGTHQPLWPNLAGFSWWNSHWTNEVGPPTEMRVQCDTQLADTFQKQLSSPRVLDRPEISRAARR